MDLDTLKVGADEVIIIRGPELDLDVIEAFGSELNDRFPDNLAVFLDGDMEFSTMPIDVLEALLREVIEHRKGADGRRP